MRILTSLLALVGCVTVWAGNAAAEPVTFSGSGVVASTSGRLNSTGLVPVGSELRFSFSFDPAAASLVQSDNDYALYEFDVADFAASLGAFTFPLSKDPSLAPLVELYRGFSFFCGNASEPSIAFSFYLFGTPTTMGEPTPFAGAAGSSQQLALSGVVRAGPSDVPLTVNGLLGLGSALQENFQYGTRDAVARQSGLVNGPFAGAFTTLAAVPEPATWTLILVGFAITGAALRRGLGNNRSAFSCGVSTP